MTDQNLELGATVVDKFSKPITDLQNRLRNMKPPEALIRTQKSFAQLRDSISAIQKGASGLSGALAGGLGLPGLSIGAFGAAGALAAVGSAVQSFTKHTITLANFSKETGLATKTLKELQGVAGGLGIDSDAVQGMLEFNSNNVAEMKKGRGNFSALGQLGAGARKIRDDITSAQTPEEALKKSLYWIAQQKTQAQRDTIGELLMGTKEAGRWGLESPAELQKRMAEFSKQAGPGPSAEDLAKAKRFADATALLSQSLTSLTDSVGAELAPEMTSIAKSFTAMAASGGQVHQFFESVREFVDGLNHFKQQLDGVADGINKTARGLMPGNIQPGDDKKLGKRLEDATKGMDTSPDANQGIHGATNPGDGYKPISYNPLQRAAGIGISSVGRSASVALLAEGVSKGMADFYQSLQGGTGDAAGGGSGGASGGGVQNASYSPPPSAKSVSMGGGGKGGSISIPSTDVPAMPGAPDPAGRRVGGTRSWRNFNPGNIEYGKFAQAHGAIGTDGRFAIFPDYATGRKAQETLLFDSKGYRDLTLSGAIHRWAPASENNVPAYLKAMGADPNTRMKDFTPAQRQQLLSAMQKHEGWRAGKIIPNPGQTPQPPAVADRPSAAKKSGAISTDGKAPHGRVDVHVHSKDTPVKVTDDKGPALQSVTLKRGRAQGLMEI